jgi:hypothetical protein
MSKSLNTSGSSNRFRFKSTAKQGKDVKLDVHGKTDGLRGVKTYRNKDKKEKGVNQIDTKQQVRPGRTQGKETFAF